MGKHATISTPPRGRRGFLLMVIIGILAILLTMCVGFLSFARSEVNAVATMRDKNDCTDVMYASLDWTIGNINAYCMNGGTSFDSSKYVAFTHSPGSGQWWYRPYEKGLKEAIPQWLPLMSNMKQKVYRWDNTGDYGTVVPACIDPNGRDEAAWVYLPENYFPEGGVLGRFMVQVMDPNSVICLNDWLDDCSPTQTQMAQMIRDSYGLQQLERYYAYRDSGNVGDWDRPVKLAPIRFQDAWHVATRSLRMPQYAFSYANASWDERPIREVSPNWVTTNTTYFSPYGAEMILRAVVPSNGVFTNKPHIDYGGGPAQYAPPTPNEGRPGPARASALIWRDSFGTFSSPDINSDYGWSNDNKWSAGQLPTGVAYSIYGYEDPDTGRCPVNVNTCYNSGERLPMNIFGGVPSYTMEGVFNIDSLRQIVQIGEFHFTDSTGADQVLNGFNPSAPNFVNSLSNPADRPKAWAKHEQLRTKLAYQYQEKLCRYFTGSYHTKRSTFQRKWPPQNANAGDNTGYTVGAAVSDYSGVRFPMGLSAFRAKVRGDLASSSTGSPFVNFDGADTPSVSKNQLDARTANAVFDNIVPGKPGQNGMPGWPDAAGGDPLLELFSYRIAREEYGDSPWENDATNMSVYGYHRDNANLRDSGAHGPTWPTSTWSSTRVGSTVGSSNSGTLGSGYFEGLSLAPKGKVIAASTAPVGPWDRLGVADAHLPTGADTSDAADAGIAKIPYRQWMFGPDWFSTELTTTTTTYIMVINAQIVDKKSVIENADKPVVVSHFQFGVAVEIAPDVEQESNTTGSGWPTGAGLDSASVNLGESGLGFYRGAQPRIRKSEGRVSWNDYLDATAVHSMDYKCGSLGTSYTGYREVVSRQAAIQNTSIPKEWKADLRGVAAGQENSFYGGSKQTARRVILRGIWSMDSSLSR